ncbi:MAG: hypothetical protein QW328_09775, partial [Nitrososphaerota archaeon]
KQTKGGKGNEGNNEDNEKEMLSLGGSFRISSLSSHFVSHQNPSPNLLTLPKSPNLKSLAPFTQFGFLT